MNSPSSPAGRGLSDAAYALAEAAWIISPGTRQSAQEADAGMTQDEWEYTPISLKSANSPVAESKYPRP